MKKLILIVTMLALASCAFAQLSDVNTNYTGSNAKRSQDLKLGFHDVLASPTGTNTSNVVDYAGCTSCHVPHGSTQTVTTLGSNYYIWKYALPANIGSNDPAVPGNIVVDQASFHTLACMSCHDGVTATDVITNNTMESRVLIASDGFGLMNDHPVNQYYGTYGTAPGIFVKFFNATGATNATGTGMVECGSCHDPHYGDALTYMFLRGPKIGAAKNPAPYTQTVAVNGVNTTMIYSGTTPQWARLGLCRDCHGTH